MEKKGVADKKPVQQPFKVNELVKHKRIAQFGIGCVSKVTSRHIYVNWGTDDTEKHTASQLTAVDTSMCEEVPMSLFRALNITNGWKDDQSVMIIGNEVKHWVGIGWVSRGVVKDSDLKKYPRLVETVEWREYTG